MQYRLLALDLDGTLVTSHGGITEAAKQAVWSYIDAGGVVALASGRPTRGLWPAQELRLAQKGGYLLSYNGGKIVNCKTGAAIYEKDIPQDLVPVIIRMIRDAGMEAISYQDQYVLLEHVDRLWFDREASVCRMEYKEVPDLAAYVTFPVVKLMACGAPEQILALEKQAREAIGSRVDVFRSEDFYLEFVAKGIDKAATLEVLLKHLGLTRDSLAAFGDSYNDIPMIKYAGFGVAMANSIPEVLQAAEAVTKSNDEDGVAHAIYRYLLDRPDC